MPSGTRRCGGALGVLVVALGVLAALLPLPLASAQPAAVTVAIRPENPRDTAIAFYRRLLVEGRAPQGAIESARLVAIESDGTRRFQEVPAAHLNQVRPTGDYLVNEAGLLNGRLTPLCLFAQPHDACPHGQTRDVVLELTVAGATGTSNSLRVDYVRPELYTRPELEGVPERDRPREYRSYKLVDTEHIEVRFTEPIKRLGPENPEEWVVTDPDREVLAVEGPREGDCVGFYPPGADTRAGDTGCTRTLVIAPVDEDAEPRAHHVASEASIGETAYEDFASNRTINVLHQVRTAIDYIRPPVPRIEQIAGQPYAERVVANQARLPVTVSNVRQGHSVVLQALVGGTVLAESPPAVVPAGQSQVTATLPLPADGVYDVRAVAQDTNGNRSSDERKRIATGRSHGSPSSFTYALDTVAPIVSSAVQTGVRTVDVTMFDVTSAQILPSGDAGEWRIDGARPTSVTGEGKTRRLTAAADLGPGEHAVTWRRTGPDQAGSYRDEAGNLLVEPAGAVRVLPLPPVPVPVVTSPARELHTNQARVQVQGTVAQPRSGLQVEILERDGSTRRAVAAVGADGTWSADVDLGADARHRFDAQVVDTSTQARSARPPVPDVVLDTRAPTVDVTRPSTRPITVGGSLDRRPRYGLGDPVPVRWSTTDPAEDDVDPDHTAGSVVTLVPTQGDPRELLRRDHAEGAQAYDHVVSLEDFAGAATREVRFGVRSHDTAGNAGTDTSDLALLTTEILGYVPVFVEASSVSPRIEARFPVIMEGSTSPADWTVQADEAAPALPPKRVEVRTVDGRTVVELTAAQPITDPNARPEVAYQPSSLALTPLRGPQGKEVSNEARASLDGIPPVLDVNAPAAGPVNAEAVNVSGRTDASAYPNDLLAYRANADGTPTGEVLAQARAATDGTFTLRVPMTRNARNAVVVVASDGPNRTVGRPFSVVEDSLAPVVALSAPKANAPIGATTRIAWTTTEAHPDRVQLSYRANGGDWRTIAAEPDDGTFDWQLPAELKERDVVDVRVAAIDKAANEGTALQPGLVVDLTAPVLTRARSTSERTVDVFFSERVVPTSPLAGFSLPDGPKVASVDVGEDRLTLHLVADLATTEPEVAYDGTGVKDLVGNVAPAGRLRAERGFAFAVTDLVGAAQRGTGTVRLSWVDARNKREHLARYEVRADGEALTTTPPGTTTAVDTDVTAATTYTVVAVDDLGNVSKPASVTVDPKLPNITPAGGFVLSDDGQVALTVPPRAVDEDYYGSFVLRAPLPRDGYRQAGATYELVAEAADSEGEFLDAFTRFSCLSFRPQDAMAGMVPERTTVLRAARDGVDEVAARVDTGTAHACVLTLGSFALAEAEGITVRVSGTEPALNRDRFSTAVALSQTTFAAAETAVIARADDYPDALAAAALADAVAGPVLLAKPDFLPPATVLELQRLGTTRVVLTGGPAALGPSVVTQLRALGFDVDRISGSTRFHTAVEIAREVGVPSGRVYLATGRNFADALSASAGSAYFGHPILLTDPDRLTDATLVGLRDLGVEAVDLLGGPAAVDEAVEARLVEEGFRVRRIAGPDRYGTAVALAEHLTRAGMAYTRPIAASGVGDGITSPDALAAGPVAARSSSPLLLVPRDSLHARIAELVAEADDLRGVAVAGGPAAVSRQTREGIDAAAR